jgi:hypothetical protein
LYAEADQQAFQHMGKYSIATLRMVMAEVQLSTMKVQSAGYNSTFHYKCSSSTHAAALNEHLRCRMPLS